MSKKELTATVLENIAFTENDSETTWHINMHVCRAEHIKGGKLQ